MNSRKFSRFSITLFTLAMGTALTACTDPDLTSGEVTAEEPGVPVPDPARAPAPAPPPASCASGINCGLTWVKARHLNPLGQDTVSCYDYTSGASTPTTCNPYVGDTDCKQVRPILCIRQDGSASNGFESSPAGAPYYYDSFYNGWAKGNIGLTHGVQGTSLTSLAVADAACVAEFGVGWRMAEHHDGGGGWGWTAYGNLNDVYTVNDSSHTVNDRFWVYINGQPAGNCW